MRNHVNHAVSIVKALFFCSLSLMIGYGTVGLAQTETSKTKTTEEMTTKDQQSQDKMTEGGSKDDKEGHDHGDDHDQDKDRDDDHDDHSRGDGDKGDHDNHDDDEKSHDDKDDKKDDHDHQKSQGKDSSHKLHKVSVSASEVTLATKSNDLHIQLNIPLESVVGFEYKPKTDKEKKALEDAKKLFQASKLFAFHQKLGCKASVSEVDFVFDDDHAEAKYHGKFSCTGLKQKQKTNMVTFQLGKLFPKLKQVELSYVPASGTAVKKTYKEFPFNVQL